MNYHDWNNYLYQLQQAYQAQNERMQALEERVDQLSTSLKMKNRNNVEKIEYHFDQLKIEKLDGTLHIGLSPNDLANIDELNIPEANQEDEWKRRALADLTNYLHHSCPNLIRSLADEYQKPIDEAYLTLILQDIEKQLPQRIEFYESEAKKKHLAGQELDDYDFTCEKIKQEILNSLRKHMQSTNSEGEEK
ncbi:MULTISPECIES: spore germination protein GerPC [unclassified Virgibacillus]|uniref:spore germination protein GerPC n=1 Tax=unclassified Virgibacillus TaxID=2620237 RepID=UPI0024DE1C29|nr:spore germination protein GerPC [Virgibacillus sp. LDC-1]